jgi:hypothetical protein
MDWVLLHLESRRKRRCILDCGRSCGIARPFVGWLRQVHRLLWLRLLLCWLPVLLRRGNTVCCWIHLVLASKRM